jgi:hypothetical protein
LATSSRPATVESQAEAIVAAELNRRRWGAEQPARRAKGDAVKLALAARLRAETTVTVKWLAEHPQMGTPGHLNHLLYLRRKPQKL